MTSDHRVAGSSPAGCKMLNTKKLNLNFELQKARYSKLHPHSRGFSGHKHLHEDEEIKISTKVGKLCPAPGRQSRRENQDCANSSNEQHQAGTPIGNARDLSVSISIRIVIAPPLSVVTVLVRFIVIAVGIG